ncbi:hypothetical protein SLEP1_g42761 [Rubroshorea leprosula]|uniref:Reverse transcriptase domain-containing protein n=1 Tax=Rubroshorea leprosula TaxID=152421 RepID=A0AAV5LAW8_9ROSI|nr:hypothetical protein SLEP1_g42761 [Rubroshorea leprosula]
MDRIGWNTVGRNKEMGMSVGLFQFATPFQSEVDQGSEAADDEDHGTSTEHRAKVKEAPKDITEQLARIEAVRDKDGWTYEQMWKTFLKFGRVFAIYSPQRKNKEGSTFGFVHFLDVKDERSLRKQLDQTQIGKQKLKIHPHRFNTKPKPVNPKHHTNTVGSPKPSYVEVVKGIGANRGIKPAQLGITSNNGKTKQKWVEKQRELHWTGLEFNPRHEDWEWFEGCFVGIARSVEIVPILQERLYMDGLFSIKLRAMGGKLVLMDCDDKEELKGLVELAKDWLGQWFVNIKHWTPQMVAKKRFVWLKCYGVPLHGWGPEFFISIANLWGNFITLNESTSSKKRFDVARHPTVLPSNFEEDCSESWSSDYPSEDTQISGQNGALHGGNSNPASGGDDDDDVALKDNQVVGESTRVRFSKDPSNWNSANNKFNWLDGMAICSQERCEEGCSVNVVGDNLTPLKNPNDYKILNGDDAQQNSTNLQEFNNVGPNVNVNYDGLSKSTPGCSKSIPMQSTVVVASLNSLVNLENKSKGKADLEQQLEEDSGEDDEINSFWYGLASNSEIIKERTSQGARKKQRRKKSKKTRLCLAEDTNSVVGASITDSAIENYNRGFHNKDKVTSALDAWNLIKEMGLGANGNEDEIIKKIELMEQRDINVKKQALERNTVNDGEIDKPGFHEMVMDTWRTVDVQGWKGYCLKEKIKLVREGQWRQKARKQWLREGDANSKFYHKCISSRQCKKEIVNIQVNGKKLEEVDKIKNGISKYFENLFKEEEWKRPNMDGISFKQISQAQNDLLVMPFSEDEIKVAVWDCGSDKTPGPNPQRIEEFRPISLIGSLYKIVAKLLANRLHSIIADIIGEHYVALIEGRHLCEGVVTENEIIDEAKRKKKKSFVFKVDFEKAFNKVNWNFLDYMMMRLGFNEIWRKWIMECLQTSLLSVLVNGSPSKQFPVSRGLKQGDPLFPFLFLIIAKGLNKIINTALDRGLYEGIKVGNSGI